jgi:hypothetical protein
MEDTYRDERCEVRREPSAPAVLVFRAQGHLTHAAARWIVAVADDEGPRHDRLLFFHDWEAVTGYDSRARLEITTWAVRNLSQLEGAHMLSTSRLVKMGISVGNLAAGGVGVLHEDRRSFELALRAAVRERS